MREVPHLSSISAVERQKQRRDENPSNVDADNRLPPCQTALELGTIESVEMGLYEV